MLLRLFIAVFVLWIALINITCSSSIVIDDDSALSKNEGVLLMRLVYKEGVRTYESITFTIESVDRLFFTKVKIETNTSKIVPLRLKANSYFFSDVYAIGDTSYSTPDRKEDMMGFYGHISENVFTIKPKTINYIGDVVVQTNRERVGRRFKLSSDSGFQINSYFFSSHSSNTLSSFKREYKSLATRYPIKAANVLYGISSISRKEAYYRTRDATYYGYGGEAYGKDLLGYKDYNWGLHKDELELALSQDGAKPKNNDDFIEATVADTKVLFHIATIGPVLWENKLYKVTVKSNSNIDKVIDDITQKHGFPKRANDAFVWELPSTIITVKKLEDKVEIEYNSKSYINTIDN